MRITKGQLRELQIRGLGKAYLHQGRNKYNASPLHYRGVRYDSKAEAARAAELDVLLQAGEILAWFRQITVRLGVPENVYRPDFLVVPHPDKADHYGVVPWFEDVKGRETEKFRRDRKLWEAYGPLELRIRRRGRLVETIKPGGKHGKANA